MMKTVLGALALVIAAPAAAQGAPAADPHAAHAQHLQQTRPSQSHQHQHGGDAEGEHPMDCCKDCCEAKEQGKMACCGKHGDHAPHDARDHSQHAG